MTSTSLEAEGKRIIEEGMRFYTIQQRYCDITSTVLDMLIKEHLNVGETLRVLDKVKETVEKSVQSADWGSPLVCNPVLNNHPRFDMCTVMDEVNRLNNAVT